MINIGPEELDSSMEGMRRRKLRKKKQQELGESGDLEDMVVTTTYLHS